MLRIGFDGRALSSPAAGVRRYVRELFGALAGLDSCITPVAIGARNGETLPAGIERGPVAPSLPGNAGWMMTGLPRAARRARLDLFHAPSYTAPFGGPRPLVLTIHDVSYERCPEWYPYKRGLLRREFYRRSARLADRVITDSEFSKREIVLAYGLEPASIDVVPLAPSSRFTAAAESPAGSPRDPFVLHVGDIHPRRNLALALQAVLMVRARSLPHRNLRLVLVGVDRGHAASLESARRPPGSGPALVMTGPVDESTLLGLYRSAVALVYPSRYEGFGLPLVEAMACGTPVIAARTSAIPEVAGDAAVLLDPDDEAAWADAIERILDDREHASRLREAGLARAREYSWTRTARETAGVYRRVLGRGV